ncbi:MAG: methionyl-tRNA formyltransferase [Spirochaetaceae bacterium]|nr:methionyl-tRNA formyltransferase [Spirochaetaceae bacterium]
MNRPFHIEGKWRSASGTASGAACGIVFAGSAKIAVPCLEALLQQDYAISAVLTNPDSAKGREGKKSPTPVGAAAESYSAQRVLEGKAGLSIFKPAHIDAQCSGEIAALKADLLVSFAYGKIFSPQFLSLFPLGGINIHPSLLPKYRGATPIQAAILGRDRETGISIQCLAEKLDSGAILAQEKIPLSLTETAEELSSLVAERAPALLTDVLRSLACGKTLEKIPQDEPQACYCGELKKEDGRIDWKRGAAQLDAQVRAYTPWPLSWTSCQGRELYILAGKAISGIIEPEGVPPGTVFGVDKKEGILIKTGGGVYCASALQYKTKKALDWKAFLNGARDFTGSLLE